MQFNNIFQTKTTAPSQPTELPIATYVELKNDYSKHSRHYTIDVSNDNIEPEIRRKFSPELSDLILNTCKQLKKHSFGEKQLLLTTVYEATGGYNYSHIFGNNPKFFLSTYDNTYYSTNSDFSNFEVEEAEIISTTTDGYGHKKLKWILKVIVDGLKFPMICYHSDIVKFKNFAMLANGDITIGNFKTKTTRRDIFQYLIDASYHSYYREKNYNTFQLDLPLVARLYGTKLLTRDELNNLMIAMMAEPGFTWNELVKSGSGITKTMSSFISPYIDDLRQFNPLCYCILKSLIEDTSRTLDSVKLSTIFNASFDGVSSLEDLIERIWPAGKDLECKSYSVDTDSWYQSQPSYKEGRKKALKSQGSRAITKIMEEVESLNLDEKLYPRTYKAITEGEISIATFFRKSEQYFIFNDNWKLWEEMLTKFPDITKELAASAAPRTTYEKDLMSYFYFVLYTLPEYLKAQTGEKWTCSPRLVNSENELEPPKEEVEGTPGVTRKRSALTPIVDNDKKTVVVPYASLAIYGGRGTTYCYSLDYQILKKGFSFKGNVVMNDVESKLNGRDDYGLMFYTLTGSEQGRGYPTFLIIFERRSTGTHVHFHRTHPSRSKDGDYNPVHNWTRVCYNWMIGNVAKENIIAQQGDLAFVKTDDDGKREFNDLVKAYDNHVFENLVYFSPYVSKTKTNILGYVKVDEDNMLQHHEHEWVKIPKGIYTVYQCRSWEANPKGVWSLRID